jgi:hypothetical protein
MHSICLCELYKNYKYLENARMRSTVSSDTRKRSVCLFGTPIPVSWISLYQGRVYGFSGSVLWRAVPRGSLDMCIRSNSINHSILCDFFGGFMANYLTSHTHSHSQTHTHVEEAQRNMRIIRTTSFSSRGREAVCSFIQYLFRSKSLKTDLTLPYLTK